MMEDHPRLNRNGMERPAGAAEERSLGEILAELPDEHRSHVARMVERMRAELAEDLAYWRAVVQLGASPELIAVLRAREARLREREERRRCRLEAPHLDGARQWREPKAP